MYVVDLIDIDDKLRSYDPFVFAAKGRKVACNERDSEKPCVFYRRWRGALYGVGVGGVKLENPVAIVRRLHEGVECVWSERISPRFSRASVHDSTTGMENMPAVRIQALRHTPRGPEGTTCRCQRQVLASFTSLIDRLPDRFGDLSARPNECAVNINTNQRNHHLRLDERNCKYCENWGILTLRNHQKFADSKTEV